MNKTSCGTAITVQDRCRQGQQSARLRGRVRGGVGWVGLIAVAQLLAAGSAFASHEGEPNATVTGEIEIVQADDFENGRSERFYWLREKHSEKTFRLRFREKPPQLRSGSTVRVRGRVKEGQIEVEGDGQAVQTIAEAEASTTVSGEQKTIVIAVNFLDAWLPCSVEEIDRLMFTNDFSVSGLYEEMSYGNVWFSGDVVGPFTIEYSSYGSCNYFGWAAAAEAAAAAEGVDLSVYPRRVYVLPRGCGWAGLATVGGNPSRSWIARCDMADVYAHELGHNLRMRHAATDFDNDGQLDCEYCDTSDVMGYSGYGLRQVNAPHKEQMGWLPPEKVVTATNTATVSLAPLEIFPQDTALPQVLKVPKPNTGEFYYFSYRRPLGYDAILGSYYTDRVSVHRYRGSGSVRTYLLAVLSDGGTFEDEVNGFSVRQIAHNDRFATVQVWFGDGHVAPLVNLVPANPTAYAGTSLQYAVSVTNLDSPATPPATFILNPSVPAGWTVSVSPSSLTLHPGQVGNATMTVQLPGSVAEGEYQVTLGVSDNLSAVHTAEATAILRVPRPSTVADLYAALAAASDALARATENFSDADRAETTEQAAQALAHIEEAALMLETPALRFALGSAAGTLQKGISKLQSRVEKTMTILDDPRKSSSKARKVLSKTETLAGKSLSRIATLLDASERIPF
jgi:prepilin-type processing-associated H-X9-DG protein